MSILSDYFMYSNFARNSSIPKGKGRTKTKIRFSKLAKIKKSKRKMAKRSRRINRHK